MTELQARIDAADLTATMQPTVVSVPRHAPLTRAQFEAWRVHWPLHFREHVERMRPPNDDEQRVHEAWMRKTVQWAMDHAHARRTDEQSHCKHGVASTAAIVNPANNELIAMAHDTRDIDRHPLRHAVMNCIEAVAAKERASNTATAAANQTTMAEGVSHKRSIDEVLEADAKESPDGSTAYLCNSYDLYTVYEPCTMCSMALLHSRIGRVFYALPHRHGRHHYAIGGGGALGSHYRLHTHPRLNHKFKVYRHLLYDEAMALMTK